MADIKKFLDQEGVQFLWSKISMQDYPNNDTLMAVIEAIDETKADKTDLVQSDWNESDETSLSYIKNKPFGHGFVNEHVADLILTNGDEWKETFVNIVIPQCSSYQTVVGTDIDAYIAHWENENLYFGDYYITNDGGDVTTNYDGVALYIFKRVYKLTQLSEIYIPSTIARISDIPEGFSGSYNDLTDKPNIPSQASDITSNLPADYATGTTVEDALLNIDSAIGSINSIIANLKNTLELITVDDIDNICGASIAAASEVQF